KLSLTAPMVLQGGPCGRVGRRRTNCGEAPVSDDTGAFCISGPGGEENEFRLPLALHVLRGGYSRPAAFRARYASARAGARVSGVASTTVTPCRRSCSAVRSRSPWDWAAAAASYTASVVPRAAAISAMYGSATEASRTVWRWVSRGRTGRR